MITQRLREELVFQPDTFLANIIAALDALAGLGKVVNKDMQFQKSSQVIFDSALQKSFSEKKEEMENE